MKHKNTFSGGGGGEAWFVIAKAGGTYINHRV